MGTPKSKRSKRPVPMCERVQQDLARLWSLSRFSADENLVFCHPDKSDGITPQSPSWVLDRLEASLKQAGVSDRRMHDLRHTPSARAWSQRARRWSRYRSGRPRADVDLAFAEAAFALATTG
jgi:integrase